MKRLILVVCLLALTLAFTAGCASKHYIIKTKDGKEFVTVGEPDFDGSTKAYRFEDLDGKEWRINREEIETIEEKQK